MSVKKKDIRALTKDQLRDFFVSQNDKPFRGNQVYEWLWRKSAHSFEDMTNISKETRQMLEDNFGRAMNLTDGISFMWERPMTLVLLILAIVLLFLPSIREQLAAWRRRGVAEGD